MSEQILAYCCLKCDECPAYLAAKDDDQNAREELAKKWSTPEYPVTPEQIDCNGCKSEVGPHFKWCAECPIRKCASERGVESCAHCDEFPCDVVRQSGEENLKRIEEFRVTLV